MINLLVGINISDDDNYFKFKNNLCYFMNMYTMFTYFIESTNHIYNR